MTDLIRDIEDDYYSMGRMDKAEAVAELVARNAALEAENARLRAQPAADTKAVMEEFEALIERLESFASEHEFWSSSVECENPAEVEQQVRDIRAAIAALSVAEPAKCGNPRCVSGIVPIGDGYSVDACPDCTPAREAKCDKCEAGVCVGTGNCVGACHADEVKP